MKAKRLLLLLIAVLVAVVMTACGSQDEDHSEDTGTTDQASNEETTEEKDEATELNGSVVIDGSGTVYPLMSRIAEEYTTVEQPGVSVEVSRSGTSTGFEKFLIENSTDFNDASRQIKDEEVAKAEDLGIKVKELKVALDGLTFVSHPDNDWASELTAEDLKNIFLADGGITTWSDLNPDFPDEKINTYGPNENHGTYVT